MGILDHIFSLFKRNNRKDQNSNRIPPQRKQESNIAAGQRGRVIHREEAGIIEAQGMTLKASIEVREFSEEEIRDQAEEERTYFEPAFWKVVKNIKAREDYLKTLLPELLIAFTSGDPRRETQAVMRHLPEGTWRWPTYEDYVFKRDGDRIKKETELIKCSGLPDLLNRLTISEIRVLYKQHSGENKRSPGRKKSDIITSLIASVGDADSKALADTLRSRLIKEKETSNEADHGEMCAAFARKVTMTAYGIGHRNQMLELKDMYPLWRLIVDHRDGMPEECRKLHGKIFRYDDPFWETHYPPCEWPDCSCRVELKMR